MELLWRWSFGLGLLALSFFAYAHLRQAVLLSDTDQAAFSGQDPFAIAAAGTNLIREALPFLVQALTQISGIAAVLWIGTAALGRGFITRSIVRRLASDYGVEIAKDAARLSSFATLAAARVLMLLIIVIGYLGGSLIAGLFNGQEQNLLVSLFTVFASLAASSVVWSYVNWVLSLAPIFVARDARSPLDSVVEALAFIRRNHSRLVAIAFRNSTLRGVAAALISIAGIGTIALQSMMPVWATGTLLALQTLAYLVISDVLLLARFGAYASVALREMALAQSLPAPSPNSSGTVVL